MHLLGIMYGQLSPKPTTTLDLRLNSTVSHTADEGTRNPCRYGCGRTTVPFQAVISAVGSVDVPAFLPQCHSLIAAAAMEIYLRRNPLTTIYAFLYPQIARVSSVYFYFYQMSVALI